MRIVCHLTIGFDLLMSACADISDIELLETETEQETINTLEQAEGLITFGSLYSSQVASAVAQSSVRWIHLMTSGIDSLMPNPPPFNIRLSTSGRIWANPVAEHAVSMLLGLLHDIHGAEKNRERRLWSRQQTMDRMRSIRNLNVLLLGFGSIGQRIAQLLTPFDPIINAVGTTTRLQNGVKVSEISHLAELLAETDVLVIALPLLSSTEKIISARQLAQLPKGSVIINVARGGVIDTAALVDALSSGQIAGAGLDVFESEPLPQAHPLWEIENVVITPHVAGFGDPTALKEMVEICRDNLQDFIAGRTLRDGISLN